MMIILLTGQDINVLKTHSITPLTDDSSLRVADIYFALIVYY